MNTCHAPYRLPEGFYERLESGEKLRNARDERLRFRVERYIWDRAEGTPGRYAWPATEHRPSGATAKPWQLTYARQ